MSRKGNRDDELKSLDELIEEITVDAYGELLRKIYIDM